MDSGVPAPSLHTPEPSPVPQATVPRWEPPPPPEGNPPPPPPGNRAPGPPPGQAGEAPRDPPPLRELSLTRLQQGREGIIKAVEQWGQVRMRVRQDQPYGRLLAPYAAAFLNADPQEQERLLSETGAKISVQPAARGTSGEYHVSFDSRILARKGISMYMEGESLHLRQEGGPGSDLLPWGRLSPSGGQPVPRPAPGTLRGSGA